MLGGVGEVEGVIRLEVSVLSLFIVFVNGSKLFVIVLKNMLKLVWVVVLKVRFKFWL